MLRVREHRALGAQRRVGTSEKALEDPVPRLGLRLEEKKEGNFRRGNPEGKSREVRGQQTAGDPGTYM